ncbi:30S ribosomal protein S12 methylthiotransferase RimO [Syntrophorhabdus aromaticivorans]|uniref:Ribosomal protein uS12 methylthiotransferase RimO n=1 Tax=Syntrophorhabdus aromaticivorans TaxID=328301 RepID=A0A971S0L8_9BACT|nr:30S ribosomal protein S12 methylthiotransferase RimO [Syntrophorhabdus aromaticivorans]NLW35525.1 30S ribosomal protein S12 methylthiotransferase RimO [Syntrophorhabdus aromaticivorans]
MNFKIISLGCPKNLVESEYIACRLEQAGHVLSDACDTVIINTCAFIADAARESIETILQEAADKDEKGQRIVVTGCLVERYREKLAELLPEVDLFAGRGFYPEIERLISKTGFFLNETGFKDTYPRKVLTSLPSAYLKIQEGCDNRCTYCTVPDIRGPLRSRPSEDIVEEFRYLLGQGFKEINVIGQDITSFGRDSGSGLKELLRLLLDVQGDYFLRLLYLHPRGIDDELIDIVGHENHIVPYLDIPIQHSEDRILHLMGRGYTRDDLESLLKSIKNRVPDITLRTTLIVGFPGESDEEFSGLCDFIKTWEFDMLGAFTYSREEGTPASGLRGHVRKPVKQARYDEIMSIQKDVSKRRLKRLEGRTAQVIIEGQDRPYMVGRLLTQAPDIDGIAFVKGSCAIGEIREGKIVKTLDYDVIVEVQ